jgi:glycosyltransferase involved in cell wall biosynthesis
VKLLLYSRSFPPSVGGVENSVISLARGLAGLRLPDGTLEFEVTVATQSPARGFDDASLPFRVFRQPPSAKLARLIWDADIIHLAGPVLTPLFWVRLVRKPLVVEHHGYQSICPNGLLLHQPDGSICPGHFQAARYTKCLRCQAVEMSWVSAVKKLLLMFPRYLLAYGAAHNIAISRHVLERHNLPRSSVIYYGIEDPLGRSVAESSAGDTPDKICFAFVGRFVPEKGIPVLLAAARQLMRDGMNFEVRLIGDGPERRNLEEIIHRNELRDHIHITGFLSGPALIDALRDVRVVVMPSVWEETAGLAAMEQMMRGRLVIASNVAGLAEIVADAGLLCVPGDSGALAECMRRVIRDPSLVDTLGRKARERALRLFAEKDMIAAHANLYRHVFNVNT